MKLFSCQKCGQMLHFENSVCIRCGSSLGFNPRRLTLEATDDGVDGTVTSFSNPEGLWRTCANLTRNSCNWLVPADTGEAFCGSCRLNRTIPDRDVPGNDRRWREIEEAKRRLIYSLLRFRLPLINRRDDVEQGLAFDFLATTENRQVLTGHANGLITINIAEADSDERERLRIAMGEDYRTLLGHMRHEVGHYYWDLLIRDGGRLEMAREAFGDERASYRDALQHHYEQGPPPDWQSKFVSSYATMHPWEDLPKPGPTTCIWSIRSTQQPALEQQLTRK